MLIKDGAGKIVGRKDGKTLWVQEYEDGKLSSQWNNVFENFDNGEPKSEIGYNEDTKHGPYKIWFENGQLKEQGRYNNGELYGTSTKWDEDGNKVEL